MSAGTPDTDDDGPVPMTARERAVWAGLAAVAVSSGVYLVLVARRLLTRPVAEVSWVEPMLWAMGLAVAGAVVLSVVFTVVAEARRRDGCSPGRRGEVMSDARDREIGRLGGRAALAAISAGSGGALILTMLDVHPFWIGNLLFLGGTAAAVAEATAQIRLYRRGFP
jgi:hypothetical protein